MKFEIKENVEINLVAEVRDGKLGFMSISTDTDWASYSLESDEGDLIAEHVSFEPLEIHEIDLLIEWYKSIDPEGYALCDDEEDTLDAAEEKLREVLDSPDTLYDDSQPDAEKSALKSWLEDEEPKIYRDDMNGHGNQFHLTFVMDGAKYEPGDREYEISPEDAVKYMFMYRNDPTTEDFSSISVIE